MTERVVGKKLRSICTSPAYGLMDRWLAVDELIKRYGLELVTAAGQNLITDDWPEPAAQRMDKINHTLILWSRQGTDLQGALQLGQIISSEKQKEEVK